MKSLRTLIKLQKTLVDEQRQYLVRLTDKLEKIEEKIAEVEITKIREQQAANDQAARHTYGAFLKDIVAKGKALEQERLVTQMAVKTCQDKLTELFEEQKRYEIAEAQRLEQEAKEERRIETIEFDEIGGVVHERNRNSPHGGSKRK